MMRTTLNFIEKVEQNEYNNQQQKEKSNNRQNYTYYNNSNANQNYSYRSNQNRNKTRITNHIREFNERLCKICNEMKRHDCPERCNRENVDAIYVGRRQWKTNWYPKYDGESLFEKDNYKKFCSSQKRRIALMLSTGCDYCVSQFIKNKSNEYDPLPLPHLLLDTSKMGFQSFINGASFHINHPIFCPRILMSNQANEKLRSANNEVRRSNCTCQNQNFYKTIFKEYT